MKKILSVICVVALLLQCIIVYPVRVQAAEIVDSGTCGEDLTWTLDDEGTLTISGTGAMADYDWGDSPWSDNYDLTSVVINEGVTSIGNCAFAVVPNLTSVTIPNGVTSIGDYSFIYCGLTAIDIPASVTSIGDRAFFDCDCLTGIWVDENNSNYSSDESGVLFDKDKTTLILAPYTISGGYIVPSTVTCIGESAFERHYNLTSVTIPNSVTDIGESAFEGCEILASVTIQDGVTTIGRGAFASCGGLISVTIPQSVTTIGEGAFASCSSLTGIWVDENNPSYCSDEYGVLFAKGKTTLIIVPCAISGSYIIPNGVTSIGNSAFEGCENLTSVTIPDGVTNIGESTFEGCYNLASVTIPDSVTTIGAYAFYECGSLTSVSIPDGVTWIEHGTFALCSGLTSVTIPDRVPFIGSYAFHGCESLTSVTIPDSVSWIDEYAFWDCDSLTSVTIPDSVSRIGQSAFASCGSLTGIWVDKSNTNYCSDEYGVLFNKSKTELITAPSTIHGGYIVPSSVTDIDDSAFAECYDLTSITIPDSVTDIGFCAFEKCYNLKNVFYTGNTDRKNAITIDEYNEKLNDATWHYEIEEQEQDGKRVFYCSGCDSYYDPYMVPEGMVTGVLDEDGTLTISGVGPMPNYAYEDSPWLDRDEIKNVIIEEGVTSIGDYAFESCDNLASVTIPNSVISIGSGAFDNCDLRSVSIPDNVTYIGPQAFGNCDNLTSVTIPVSVTSISAATFWDCDSLTSVTIPGSVTSIGDYAFGLCVNLTSVTIPGSVTSIGDYAFGLCINLTSVTIPDSVTWIGQIAFWGCDSLTSITIPASVTELGYGALGDCDNLTEITFMGNAPIGIEYTFGEIPTTCYYPADNSTWNESVFSKCPETITWIPSSNKVVIPIITGKSFSLSFEDEILVNFYYTVSDLTNVAEHGMLVFYADPGTVDIANADAVYNEPLYDSAIARYMVTTDGIAAKEMGDTHYYVAYAKLTDGSYVYSSSYDYSPKKYSMNMLGKDTTSAKQKELCVAMLNYGAAAQSYFGYNTDSLMNAGLTAEQQALVIAYDKTLFTGAVNADANKIGNFAATATGFSKKNATVSFEGAFCVNYYFTPNATVSGDMTLYIWTPEAYAAADTLTAENATTMTMVAGSNGRYWGQVTGIAAKSLDETYYVAAVYTDADGNTYCTGVIAYSLSKYCLSKAVDGNEMQQLASATAMYGYYAKKYFA